MEDDLMPVVEIIDSRTQHHVLEYDAAVEDASIYGNLFLQPYLPIGPEDVWFQNRKTITEILSWANEFHHPVILYLYDADRMLEPT